MLLAPVDPCDQIGGAAHTACKGGGSKPSLPDPVELDPLKALAHKVADAAAWCTGKLADSIDSASHVDFTNLKFVQQYAIVFAASVVLTLVLWLIAVAKRAVRGCPLTTAFGEAFGFLWMLVAASAFTPLILQTVVSTTDAVTDALAGSDISTLLRNMAAVFARGGEGIGGGPIILIIVSLLAIVAAGLVYVELFLRAAALYVGALLGVVVYSGLVDRDLWPKVRRWVGVMIALILVRPIIMIALGISGKFTEPDGSSSGNVVVAGIVVVLVAIGAGIAIFRFVPGYGDDIMSGIAMRAAVTTGRGAAKIGGGAASIVAQGIQTHGARGSGNGGNSIQTGGGRKGSSVNGVGEGIAAHGSRNNAKPKPKGTDKN